MPSVSPKDTIEAEFIKYFYDKTVVLNNLIIIGLLLLKTHGYDSGLHSQSKLINAKFHAGYCIHTSQNKTIFKHLESDTVPLL